MTIYNKYHKRCEDVGDFLQALDQILAGMVQFNSHLRLNLKMDMFILIIFTNITFLCSISI